MKELKPKPCSWCRKEYIRWNSTQTTCSVNCALAKLKDRQDKGLIQASKKEESLRKRDLRARKQALKSKSDWLRETQAVFNKFIRLRDDAHGCISCSENLREIQGQGGMYDAGHYRSRGSSPELRFHEDNCFKQCKKCNRQLSGNVVEMRKGILKRIGYDRLQKVEGFHDPKHYTIDDIKEIKATYQQRCRELNR